MLNAELLINIVAVLQLAPACALQLRSCGGFTFDAPWIAIVDATPTEAARRARGSATTNSPSQSVGSDTSSQGTNLEMSVAGESEPASSAQHAQQAPGSALPSQSRNNGKRPGFALRKPISNKKTVKRSSTRDRRDCFVSKSSTKSPGGSSSDLSDHQLLNRDAIDLEAAVLLDFDVESGLLASGATSESGSQSLEKCQKTPIQVHQVGETCAMCLGDLHTPEGFPVSTLQNCGHQFHSACIGRWMSRSRTCPLCRAVPVVAKFDRNMIKAIEPWLPSRAEMALAWFYESRSWNDLCQYMAACIFMVTFAWSSHFESKFLNGLTTFYCTPGLIILTWWFITRFLVCVHRIRRARYLRNNFDLM